MRRRAAGPASAARAGPPRRVAVSGRARWTCPQARRRRCSSATSDSPGRGRRCATRRRREEGLGDRQRPNGRRDSAASRPCSILLARDAPRGRGEARLGPGGRSRPAVGEGREQRARDMALHPARRIDPRPRGRAAGQDGGRARRSTPCPTPSRTPPGTAKALAGVLGGEPGDVPASSCTRDSSFFYIARKVDVDRAAAVEHLGIEGIGFLEDSRRTYPSGELACQVLGFVGVDDKGLSGPREVLRRRAGGHARPRPGRARPATAARSPAA